MQEREPAFRLPDDIAEELREDAALQAEATRDPDLEEIERLEALGLYMEALAALEAADLPIEPKVHVPIELARAALVEPTADQVHTAADALAAVVLAALAQPWDAVDLLAWRHEVEDALLLRQRAERRARGAALLGVGGVNEAQRDAMTYFDELIRPLVWSLAFASEMREGHAMLVAPRHRENAWWWTEGLEVDWETVRVSASVAELVVRYPTFANRFAEMQAAFEAAWRSAGNERLERAPSKPAIQKQPVSLRLAAASEMSPGEAREVLDLGDGARVFLVREDTSFSLVFVIEPPDEGRVTGLPRLEEPGGVSRTFERYDEDWIVRLGAAVPATFCVSAVIDGQERRGEVRTEEG